MSVDSPGPTDGDGSSLVADPGPGETTVYVVMRGHMRPDGRSWLDEVTVEIPARSRRSSALTAARPKFVNPPASTTDIFRVLDEASALYLALREKPKATEYEVVTGSGRLTG